MIYNVNISYNSLAYKFGLSQYVLPMCKFLCDSIVENYSDVSVRRKYTFNMDK